MRIIFAGTPEFAAIHLQGLLARGDQVIAVYTQPDRPAGRGKKLQESPVKAVALAHGIPVYQPASLKGAAEQQQLAALAADLMVVVAYGLLLPKAVLEAPRLGCINVHASLLPRWRGAAPIQRAIEAGDSETGVTIMQMDEGLDTGAMLATTRCAIEADDTAASLHDRLAALGVPALTTTIDALGQGCAVAEAQNDALSCYAAKIRKEEAELDWQQPAALLERRVRAFNPFPIAYTQCADQRLKIWAARALPASTQAAPGTIVSATVDGIAVACGAGQLALQQLQLPGGKVMSAAALLNGHADLFSVGRVLGAAQP